MIRRRPLWACLFTAALANPPASAAIASAAEDAFRGGGVFERIACADDTTTAYALYLPLRYSPSRRWPILYCFDPAGRGMVPIDLFRGAAERQGIIVASAHGFSSGSSDAVETGAILASIWNDTQRRFPVDLGRVYAAGFSGGGRIAWLLDSVARDVDFAGIIEVGAGLPWPELPGDYRPSGLAVCGLCGRVDFNYYEMLDLQAKIEGIAAATRFRVFDGGHAWPPEDECRRALSWMEVLAVARGHTPSDSLVLLDHYAAEITEARSAVAAGRRVEAAGVLESLVRSYLGIRGWDCSQAARELEEIRLSEEYRRESRDRERLDALGRARIDEAASLLDSVAGEADFDRLPAASALLDSLGLSQGAGAGRVLADAGEEVLTQRRIAEAVYVRVASDLPIRLLRRGDPHKAALLLMTAVALAPDRPGAWYNLAAARARSDRPAQAMESLRRAVALGFRDAELMRRDPDLASLRSDPEFLELMEEIEAP